MLIGFTIINHPFWGTPIFGNIHITVLYYCRCFPDKCDLKPSLEEAMISLTGLLPSTDRSDLIQILPEKWPAWKRGRNSQHQWRFCFQIRVTKKETKSDWPWPNHWNETVLSSSWGDLFPANVTLRAFGERGLYGLCCAERWSAKQIRVLLFKNSFKT